MTNVPWEIVEPHREQAMRNHYQTLERLAERGGLSVDELAAVLEDRDWRKMETADALAVIARHLAGMV
jgi:lambda repressor-like predicted transcriptional regulator